ncbi:sugar kinase [Virgibacillus profundi]|uniref:Sugar kinase n=1 Tax=Virgibacillus profundi TaxID=2024555 RepID=A0A2A2IHS1_9BACI|nr:ROK family transcriptional regulator [Virgibacillus profundi]PAV31177.1 sugar kinase [Virgibacillus profundi]PXY55359.1 ROK family transcriptional regulator [Virgibacillus profundi]
MRRGSFQLMKSVNKSIILNKIRTSEPISRAQIAKDTKLTPPTVSSIVKELLEQGIVRESELGESMGGRKPTMLHINSNAFYVIGVDAGPQTVECILTNLSGEIFERTSSKLIKPITNDQFISILKENVHKILQSSTTEREKIIGIGVAMHGVVDVETGTSLTAPNLGLREMPIKAELEKEFGTQVYVENDARAMALGEAWFGGHGDVDSMVAVNIGQGIGSGVVINGKLYHGEQDIAGELGHMTIDIHGEICDCGNRGCLQTFASGKAIADRARHQVKYSIPGEKLTGKYVYEMAQNGEAEYIRILEETGKIIGIGLTNLIHLINPAKIVLGGGVMRSEKFMLPSIKAAIAERALIPQAKETEVTVTVLGDNATLLGAVSLLLVDLFDPV